MGLQYVAANYLCFLTRRSSFVSAACRSKLMWNYINCVTTQMRGTVYSVTAARCGASSVWGSGSLVARIRADQRDGWPASRLVPHAAPDSVCSIYVKSSDLVLICVLCVCMELREIITFYLRQTDWLSLEMQKCLPSVCLSITFFLHMLK